MWGSSTFSFCEKLWAKQNYTQFRLVFMVHVLNGISGSYMDTVSSNLWRTKSQISGQVYRKVLPREPTTALRLVEFV